MYFRDIASQLLEYTVFPVIAVLGPRQSGKTTIVRKTFANYVYVNFENPQTRELALTDPEKFLRTHENSHGIIIDEFQYVPQILSYIQIESDEKKRPGYFVLTGSQNFLANQSITQSLAGRVGILTLLPLSLHELSGNKLIGQRSIDDMMFLGSYPRIYEAPMKPAQLYPSYVQTYIERDVRQLINVGNINAFTRFLSLCAARIGQQLNLSELATVCGVSVGTVQRWISVLEASYIVFLLQPHFVNFNKRLTKAPKLYFYDTGLACFLLGIESAKILSLSSFRGSLFESFIIADIYKQYHNRGKRPSVYYWRDLNGRIEVDCIIDKGSILIPVEIKSSETLSSRFFESLLQWNELSKTSADNNILVYAGNQMQTRTVSHVIGWQGAGNLLDEIEKE